MSDAPPMIRFRCTTTIDGHEVSATMNLKRSVWDSSDEPWRAEHLDSVRLRFSSWVRRETGVELPEDEMLALTVSTLPN
ncbi:hypothetical protein [Streptomyces sp. NPDC056707]|uniref:hypothetical protein n=1 Tax=Streptomyces sp. NPDC056707 TaxID=3345919 RepID=UPI0036CC8E52